MKDLLGDTHCEPVQPAAAWLGGKRKLSKTICKRIAALKHTTYVEPFVGLGGVFLRRPFLAQCEIINDINGELVNLFRILQRHYPQFMDCLKFQIASRRDFDRLLKTDPATLTDLERAGRFLYLQRLAFGGKAVFQSFGVSTGTTGRFNVTKLEPLLADIHERLCGVTVENLPWHDVIEKYDSPETLFYLDPPYFGGETDYGQHVFSRSDFGKIAKKLGAIEGRFLLSINDTPEIRACFGHFHLQELEIIYDIAKDKGTPAKELIVSN
ncbi:MAG: DNA adenine methylase [Pseudomonadota bacterium]